MTHYCMLPDLSHAHFAWLAQAGRTVDAWYQRRIGYFTLLDFVDVMKFSIECYALRGHFPDIVTVMEEV